METKSTPEQSVARTTSFHFRHGEQELKSTNRIVVPPMASATANSDGFATAATLEHYRRLAESGAGIVFVEYSFVHVSGRSEPQQLAVDADDKIPGLREIAQVIQSAGALAGIQLVHAGGKSTTELVRGPLLGPSAIVVPAKDRIFEAPTAMTTMQIAHYQTWFVDGAQRAQKAGFDIIELHAAHGYGLNQWLSPLTNQRTDIYGGNTLSRARMLFEILRRIRTACGPLQVVAVRLPGQEHASGGLTATDVTEIVQKLEIQGLVNLLDVSSGLGGWRRPEGRMGEGYLVSDAANLKRTTSLPVIGVGGIESGEFIDHALRQRWLDFAAVGRAILKDPRAWRSVSSRV
jgi:NADPH2 dehydrogenase